MLEATSEGRKEDAAKVKRGAADRTQRPKTGRKAAAKEAEQSALLNGIEAPAREKETQLESAPGSTAYIDAQLRAVSVHHGDKIYVLGGAAAVERLAKRANLSDKDRDALRELDTEASASPADPYELDVLKRVFDSVLRGAEAVGFDITPERLWLQSLGRHSKASA